MKIQSFLKAPSGWSILVTIVLILAFFSIGYLATPKGIPQGYVVTHKGTILASAYNSLPGQTDDSPWTTASGTRCREGVIASNHFPIGTRIMIEGHDQLKGKVFVVEDRMNKRYTKKIDIWFRSHKDALKFGNRKVKYFVLASA